MSARRQRIGVLDRLAQRNNPRLFATKQAGDTNHAIFMGNVKNVTARSLYEIAGDLGDARLSTVQIRPDGGMSIMPLDRFTFFGADITGNIGVPANALSDGNILYVKVTGYLFQNTGSNQTITPRAYLGKTSSETLITSETAFSVPSGTKRGFSWELTIRQASCLGMNVTCQEEFRLDGATAGTPHIKPVFTPIIDIERLEEIDNMFLRIANGATATMFVVLAGTLQVTTIPVVGLEEMHWIDQPVGTDGHDTIISNATPTTNYGTNATLYAGEQISSTQLMRTLIKFPRISNIPANAQIISAMLHLRISFDYANNARTLEVYRVLRDWTEAGATWNTYDGTNAWGTAGCGNNTTDYDGSIVWGSVAFSAAETIGVLKGISLDVDELKKFLDGTYQNYGWMLKMQTELDDMYGFYSAENGISDLAPILEVVYTVPN